MKSLASANIKPLCFLCVLCGCVLQVSALDREAFSITNYHLNVRVEPEQHRLGVRGRIILRNDTQSPQKIAVLQISSSLDWKSIKAGDKAVQFVTQPLTSDIDHTGGLSEAIVTLAQAVAPLGTIELEIGYEGVVVLDATRLRRISTPNDVAASSDWDQIDTNFTAVRGAGYVAWYPIATDVANLSDGDLFEVLDHWKAREADAQINIRIESTAKCAVFFSGYPDGGFVIVPDQGILSIGVFNIGRLGTDVPTFVLADYKQMDVKGTSSIAYSRTQQNAAQAYADLLGTLDPLPGPHGPTGIQVVQLPDPAAASFVSERLLLTPLQPTVTDQDRLTLVYALARRKARSPHPWINEGLAHLAQVIDIEHQHRRAAALAYLEAHQSILVDLEKHSAPTEGSPPKNEPTSAARSLISATDEMYVQNKAMWVWSMLRDMVGVSLDLVLSSYQAPDDKSSSYMPDLFAKHTQRDLGWFFDDWVYHDRGLPDFKIESVFSAKTATDTYVVTITVDNLGAAGAEVPVIISFAGADVVKRIEVRAKSKATIRVETPTRPTEVVVNDGSVPESDVTNNVFRVDAANK